MPSKKSSPNPKNVEEIFERLAALYPDPQTELEYGNAFQLLVAVVLSAQATDKSVNLVTRDFFQKVTTPEELTQLSLTELENVLKTIGLYRSKAKNVLALSQLLIEKHGSEVPLTEAELQALPGVGRKTAHVVLNTLLGAPLIAVDTHVYRVSRRLGIADHHDRDRVGDQLMARVPKRFLVEAHHYLIFHGRRVCQARKPLCDSCTLSELCQQFNTSKKSVKKDL